VRDFDVFAVACYIVRNIIFVMFRWIILICGTGVAIVILKYRYQLKGYIGDVGFADKIFGPGGTYSLLVVLAFVSFFGSLMYFLGTIQTLFHDYLGPFFGVG